MSTESKITGSEAAALKILAEGLGTLDPKTREALALLLDGLRRAGPEVRELIAQMQLETEATLMSQESALRYHSASFTLDGFTEQRDQLKSARRKLREMRAMARDAALHAQRLAASRVETDICILEQEALLRAHLDFPEDEIRRLERARGRLRNDRRSIRESLDRGLKLLKKAAKASSKKVEATEPAPVPVPPTQPLPANVIVFPGPSRPR
jgi:hypothetical protein